MCSSDLYSVGSIGHVGAEPAYPVNNYRNVVTWNLWIAGTLWKQRKDGATWRHSLAFVNLQRMCHSQLNKPVHCEWGTMLPPREWRSKTSAVIKDPRNGRLMQTTNTVPTIQTQAQMARQGVVVQTNVYPNIYNTARFPDTPARPTYGNHGPPTFTGVYEQIMLRNDNPGTWLS